MDMKINHRELRGAQRLVLEEKNKLSTFSNLEPHRRMRLFWPFLSVFSVFSVVNGYSSLVLAKPGYGD
jgi:hypothetical protein